MNYAEIVPTALATSLRDNTGMVEFEKDFHVVNCPRTLGSVNQTFVEYLELKWQIYHTHGRNGEIMVNLYIYDAIYGDRPFGMVIFGLDKQNDGESTISMYNRINDVGRLFWPNFVGDFKSVVDDLTQQKLSCCVENYVDLISRLIFNLSNCYYKKKELQT